MCSNSLRRKGLIIDRDLIDNAVKRPSTLYLVTEAKAVYDEVLGVWWLAVKLAWRCGLLMQKTVQINSNGASIEGDSDMGYCVRCNRDSGISFLSFVALTIDDPQFISYVTVWIYQNAVLPSLRITRLFNDTLKDVWLKGLRPMPFNQC